MRGFHSPHPCHGKLLPQNGHWTEQRARGIEKNRSVSRPWGLSPVSKEQKVLPSEDGISLLSPHLILFPLSSWPLVAVVQREGKASKGNVALGGPLRGEGSPRMPASRWPLTTRTESHDCVLAIREAESMFSLLPGEAVQERPRI